MNNCNHKNTFKTVSSGALNNQRYIDTICKDCKQEIDSIAVDKNDPEYQRILHS